MGRLKTLITLVLSIAAPEAIAMAKALYSAAAGFGALLKDDGTPATAAELDAVWDQCEANLRTLRSEREASQVRVAADIAAGKK